MSGTRARAFTRRQLMRTTLGAGVLASCGDRTSSLQQPERGVESRLRVETLEVVELRVTERTVWRHVVLRAGDLVGVGEASLGPVADMPQVRAAFELVRGHSPFDIEGYRQRSRPLALEGGLLAATAVSAVEQALWDLVGRARQAPVWELLGGRLRESVRVYANINRATQPRTPQGFAENAQRAAEDGFTAIKAAPFDGLPAPDDPEGRAHGIEQGVAAVWAMRKAVPQVDILVDAHSYFDVNETVELAKQLEGARLGWLEEPIAPTETEATVEVHARITQTLAGGEMLFGVEGFAPLCRAQAVDVIMPDVKHCGGVKEALLIAGMAQGHGIRVSPHNPSGPWSTAVSAHVCACLPNFELLEMQWGEVEWRGSLVAPAERFSGGRLELPEGPGFGVELQSAVALAHAL